MAKLKIKTRAFVHKGGELVDVDTLSPEDRQEVATQLALNWFNALYAGRAEFRRTSEIDPNDGRIWEPAVIGPRKKGSTEDESETMQKMPGGGDGRANGAGLEGAMLREARGAPGRAV